MTMTNAQIIALARQHLNAGNSDSYMKLMNGGIRKSGTRGIPDYATAAGEDGFRVYTTPNTIVICPPYANQ
jgi:hypothetical protein